MGKYRCLQVSWETVVLFTALIASSLLLYSVSTCHSFDSVDPDLWFLNHAAQMPVLRASPSIVAAYTVAISLSLYVRRQRAFIIVVIVTLVNGNKINLILISQFVQQVNLSYLIAAFAGDWAQMLPFASART